MRGRFWGPGMAAKKDRDKPRFPRRKWKPGQAARVEPPEKGKGASYRRDREQEETEREIQDWRRRRRDEPAAADDDDKETPGDTAEP